MQTKGKWKVTDMHRVQRINYKQKTKKPSEKLNNRIKKALSERLFCYFSKSALALLQHILTRVGFNNTQRLDPLVVD